MAAKLRIEINGPSTKDVHLFVGETEISHLVKRMQIATAVDYPNTVSLQLIGTIEVAGEWEAELETIKLQDIQNAVEGETGTGLAWLNAVILGKAK